MKVNFLIAEDIRAEQNGKVTILGLFPGDTIIMLKGARPEGLPEDAPGALDRLAILATVIGAPDGLHKFKGRIITPSGELSSPEFSLGEGTTATGYSHTVVVELRPFVVKQPGPFQLEFFVDHKMFKFPFEIRMQTQTATATQT